MHFEAGARSERSGFFFVGKTGRLLSRNGVPQADRERNRQKAGIIRKSELILIIIIKNRNFLMAERNEGKLQKKKVVFYKNIIDD